jgi:hypothetical protein
VPEPFLPEYGFVVTGLLPGTNYANTDTEIYLFFDAPLIPGTVADWTGQPNTFTFPDGNSLVVPQHFHVPAPGGMLAPPLPPELLARLSPPALARYNEARLLR